MVAFSKVKSEDPEWFFFSPVGLKYTNSSRCNRATNAGYWKTTGKERKIKTRGTNNVIGTKKTLVFYKGRVPRGVKTNWVIHEYHAVTFPDDKVGRGCNVTIFMEFELYHFVYSYLIGMISSWDSSRYFTFFVIMNDYKLN